MHVFASDSVRSCQALLVFTKHEICAPQDFTLTDNDTNTDHCHGLGLSVTLSNVMWSPHLLIFESTRLGVLWVDMNDEKLPRRGHRTAAQQR
jgi:hypothetical protein